ncbi:MAG: hypothetical protein ACKO96_12190, partial [Flammeovirgaceae bacterium]
VKPSNLGVSGGFQLTVLPSDTLQAIAKSVGQTSEKGVLLPWLSWLLYEGVSPIVRGYDVKITGNIYSRTGGALMIKSNKNWRVPGEFAGTVTDNWVTRAIDSIEKDIIASIKQTGTYPRHQQHVQHSRQHSVVLNWHPNRLKP